MHKILLRYFLSFLLMGALILLTINYIILPLIANKNDEVYIPDVKGLNLEEATILLSDFNIRTFYIDHIAGYNPDEILSTSPRAFTKVKEGREIKLTVIADKKDIIINDFKNTSLRSAELFF